MKLIEQLTRKLEEIQNICRSGDIDASLLHAHYQAFNRLYKRASVAEQGEFHHLWLQRKS